MSRRFLDSLIFIGILSATMVLFAMCTSCATPKASVLRPTQAQYGSAISITAVCTEGSWYGSGVIVSKDKALTAAHVVTGTDCIFMGTTATGVDFVLVVDVVLSNADVARVSTVAYEFTNFDRPFVGHVPAVGSRVCIASAIPRAGHVCGEVQWPLGDLPGDIKHTATTEPGNSGSGIYTSGGALIGIVTHLWYCTNGQICGGKATSLWDRRWLINNLK